LAVETPTILNPIAIGQIVARNVVPIVGVIAFGWSAVNVLLLYFVDTMLSMGVMFAGLASYFSRESTEPGLAARINGEAGAIAVAVFLCVFIAVSVSQSWELDRTRNRMRRSLIFYGWRVISHDLTLMPGETFLVRPRRLFGVLPPDSHITELVLPENAAHRGFILLCSADTAQQREMAAKLNGYLSM